MQRDDAITYDFNNQGSSFQCVSVAFSEKAKKSLEERGYYCFFSPEKDGTNCWILCRVESEASPSTKKDESIEC